MKGIVNLKNLLLMLTLVFFATGFTLKNSESVKFYDPVGVWDWTVSTDEGDMTGEMTISQNEDKEFELSIETDQFGTIECDDVTLDGNTMEATAEVEGDIIEFEFEFDGDTMEGFVATPDGDLPIEAERRKGK